MTPCVPQHREWLEAFRKRYWDFYKELLVYRQDPAPERAAQLREEFDKLFATVTGYDELDLRIARTKADKTYLLMALEHPEVPLHTTRRNWMRGHESGREWSATARAPWAAPGPGTRWKRC